jgi:hypothetical protein
MVDFKDRENMRTFSNFGKKNDWIVFSIKNKGQSQNLSSKNNLKTYLKSLKDSPMHFFSYSKFRSRERKRAKSSKSCKDTTVGRVLIFLSLLTNVLRIIFAKFESQITYFLGFMNFFVKFRNFMTFFPFFAI